MVRNAIGYIHIPQRYAPLIYELNLDHLNLYVNYHRPYLFPVETTDERTGKQVKRYPYEAMMKPFDKLKSLPNSGQYLKQNVTMNQLNDIATAMSDTVSADELNEAR